MTMPGKYSVKQNSINDDCGNVSFGIHIPGRECRKKQHRCNPKEIGYIWKRHMLNCQIRCRR